MCKWCRFSHVTLDVVAENGKAANFLDIGGGAKAETVSSALEVLEADQM